MPDLRILLTERPDLVLTIDDDFIGSAYSPMVEVTEIEGGHEVSITSKGASGIKTDTFDVINGVDGVSPTVSIESTTEEHTVTITDRDGEHEYTVYTYAAQEAARAAAESQRVAAEQARVTAESSRASAETDRETAWATISAQVTSATQAATSAAQNASQAASDASDAAGHASDVATSAAAAERERVTTEATRADAETARANTESARASAETARATAESARATAESQRASAETSRQSAEQGRASAETARVTAETARVSAETARATEWAEIESEAQSTIDAAQDAADDATAAAAEARAASAATWLSGNVLFGELSEAAVLTTDDAYAAPPKGVEVYGKSTQASYTGINLWDEVWEYAYSHVRSVHHLPLEPNVTYYLKAPTGSQWANVYCYDANDTQVLIANAASTFTTPANVSYGMVVTGGSYGTTYKNDICVNVSDPAINGTYEPYVGGKAAPNPDYPQPIESVDDLTLHVCGKNLVSNSGNAYSLTGSQYATYNIASGLDPDAVTALTFSLQATVPSSQSLMLYVGGIRIYDVRDYFDDNVFRVTNAANIKKILDAGSIRIYSTPYTGGSSVVTQIDTCQLEIGTTATTYAPYVGQSVEIPLSDHVGRSLPDGTRDTLTLSYIGPSTREGWGVFRKVLTQKVDTLTLDGTQQLALAGWRASETSIGFGYAANTLPITTNALLSNKLRVSLYDDLYYSRVDSGMTHGIAPAYSLFVRVPYPELTTTARVNAWLAENPITIQYALATPVTHDLGTVELPILPNPLTAWADGGSAQPTLSMSYEQDINIVIARLKDAIADMATS